MSLSIDSRCDPVRGGSLPVAGLPEAVLGAPGAAAGESSGAEGGSQEPGEAEEGLLSSPAGPPPAATVEGAEQRPGQAVWHHTRYKPQSGFAGFSQLLFNSCHCVFMLAACPLQV